MADAEYRSIDLSVERSGEPIDIPTPYFRVVQSPSPSTIKFASGASDGETIGTGSRKSFTERTGAPFGTVYLSNEAGSGFLVLMLSNDVCIEDPNSGGGSTDTQVIVEPLIYPTGGLESSSVTNVGPGGGHRSEGGAGANSPLLAIEGTGGTADWTERDDNSDGAPVRAMALGGAFTGNGIGGQFSSGSVANFISEFLASTNANRYSQRWELRIIWDGFFKHDAAAGRTFGFAGITTQSGAGIIAALPTNTSAAWLGFYCTSDNATRETQAYCRLNNTDPSPVFSEGMGDDWEDIARREIRLGFDSEMNRFCKFYLNGEEIYEASLPILFDETNAQMNSNGGPRFVWACWGTSGKTGRLVTFRTPEPAVVLKRWVD